MSLVSEQGLERSVPDLVFYSVFLYCLEWFIRLCIVWFLDTSPPSISPASGHLSWAGFLIPPTHPTCSLLSRDDLSGYLNESITPPLLHHFPLFALFSFKEVITVKWDQMGGPLSIMTDVLLRKGRNTRNTEAQRKAHLRTQQEGGQLFCPKREASGEIKPVHIFDLGLPASKTVRK